MAFMDSGEGNPEDTGEPDSSDTPPDSPEGGRGRGIAPQPRGGPILAALQRQAQGPQASAPGPGNMADSLGKVKIAIDLLQISLNGFEPDSRQYKDILHALTSLSRHLPEENSAQPGLQETHLIDLLRRGKQNPILQSIAGLLNGGGGAGGAGGGEGGGGGPQPPMPSTPLPGA